MKKAKQDEPQLWEARCTARVITQDGDKRYHRACAACSRKRDSVIRVLGPGKQDFVLCFWCKNTIWNAR